MVAYYNDHDKNACAWLRELIKAGLIADGEVDDRSIIDVRPVDLDGFTQCHFFAGIGGWSYALRLAGWPDDRPVWTGSPPCQPFSVAGRGLGRDDARHIAPHFVDLVRACRPDLLFGEQVASAAVVGRAASSPKQAAGGSPAWAWLDDLFVRLESAGYAAGAADIPAAGVGAPHIRQRTFFGAVDLGSDRADWIGHAAGAGSLPSAQRGIHRGEEGSGAWDAEPKRHGSPGRLANRDRDRRIEGREIRPVRAEHDDEHGRATRGLAEQPSSGRREERPDAGRRAVGDHPEGRAAGHGASSAAFGLGDSLGAGLEGHSRYGDGSREPGRFDQDPARPVAAPGAVDSERPGPTNGFWRSADWLACRDGKWRPVEPGTFPLAHGLPARVGRLRGYGNAINPHAAAEFVIAFMDAACADQWGGWAEQEARE